MFEITTMEPVMVTHLSSGWGIGWSRSPMGGPDVFYLDFNPNVVFTNLVGFGDLLEVIGHSWVHKPI